LLLLAISFLVVLGLYFIPPGQEAIEYDYAELEQDQSINSKVGWYQVEYTCRLFITNATVKLIL